MSKRLKNYPDSAYILISWWNAYAVFVTYANVDRWISVANPRVPDVSLPQGRAEARPLRSPGGGTRFCASANEKGATP